MGKTLAARCRAKRPSDGKQTVRRMAKKKANRRKEKKTEESPRRQQGTGYFERPACSGRATAVVTMSQRLFWAYGCECRHCGNTLGARARIVLGLSSPQKKCTRVDRAPWPLFFLGAIAQTKKKVEKSEKPAPEKRTTPFETADVGRKLAVFPIPFLSASIATPRQRSSNSRPHRKSGKKRCASCLPGGAPEWQNRGPAGLCRSLCAACSFFFWCFYFSFFCLSKEIGGKRKAYRAALLFLKAHERHMARKKFKKKRKRDKGASARCGRNNGPLLPLFDFFFRKQAARQGSHHQESVRLPFLPSFFPFSAVGTRLGQCAGVPARLPSWPDQWGVGW